MLDRKAVNRGRTLFHQVGCTICHTLQDDQAGVPQSTSIPLVGIERKFTIDSLTKFVKNSHAVSPSGRMPSLNLVKKEPEEIAQYLIV